MILKRIWKEFKEKIKRKLAGMVGIDIIKEEIDSIYYILDKGVDIRAFPKAEGALRDYQLADTELLRLFHEACKKHNLTYWLDWGTLLGAVRHNGFIPWDDDLDVAMPRDDYNKAKTLIVDEFTALGFSSVVKNAIYIWNDKSCLAIDIYAVDKIEFDGDYERLKIQAADFFSECLKKYEPSAWRQMDGIDELREKMITSGGNETIYFSAIESTGRLCVYKPEEIFPLKAHAFEQYEFLIPNSESYVRTQYNDYLSYPRQGILHHIKNGTPIYLKATENNESISDITEKLSGISLK